MRDALASKRCPDCEETKPLSDFYKNRSTRDGVQVYCKKCWDVRAKARNVSTSGRGYHRNSYLKSAYGIDLAEYNRLLELGDGKCWACEQPETATNKRTGTVWNLAVDHDHATGEVRGLLCFNCNTTLRATDDDVQRLRDLIEYLTTGKPVQKKAA